MLISLINSDHIRVTMMGCANYHLKNLSLEISSKYVIIWIVFVYNVNDDCNGEMQKCPINRYFRVNYSKWNNLLPITNFNKRFSCSFSWFTQKNITTIMADYKNIHNKIIQIIPNWKQSKYPSTGKWINKSLHTHMLECYIAIKSEWITDIHNIDRSQKHYGWKMPCTKMYTIYNSNHMKFEHRKSVLWWLKLK